MPMNSVSDFFHNPAKNVPPPEEIPAATLSRAAANP